MLKILGLMLIFATILGSCGQNAGSRDSFGKKLKFSKNVPLDVGEFTITLNEKKRTIGDTPPGVPSDSIDDFSFRIQKDSVDEIMTWTAENGSFRPWRFEISGQRYEFELRMSDKLGRLAEDEIVVWKK